MKQSEEYFLGEEGVILFDEIQHGKLNIINAPCGSGKTTFVEERLWTQAYWGDLLYLIDTNTVSASRGKPTNGEFIARMVNVVKANVQRAA